MAGAEFAGERRAECPSCGAPIAFRLGSSQAAICSFCRFSVVRSDRDLSLRGKVADLVPTAAPLAVGDEGSVGGRAFRVLGRMQLDHGRGPWDEWYLGFSDQGWGWLARAEGVWYLTFARDLTRAPAFDDLPPGSETALDGTGSVRWKVAERGGSAVLSAEGELPFAVDPQGSGRYVDLEGDENAFATLDFGDGSEPPQLFAGRALRLDELSLGRRALGPRPVEKVAVKKLACPGCGAPIAIFVPGETERCACAACGALLDHQAGTLSLLMQLRPPEVAPLIPLGSEGVLRDRRRTVIGFMQRHVRVDGDLYTFREYLLHAEDGYSWLVEENHHWLFTAPISASVLQDQGSVLVHEDVAHRVFARGEPEVDFVVGEFYWKVMQGDRAQTVDYVAPPRMVSVERTEREESWSAGSYLTPDDVARAFGLTKLPKPSGIAPAQPNPFARGGSGKVLALLVFVWFLLAFAYECGNHKQLLMDADLALVDTPQGKPVAFSQPFTITKTTTLEVSLQSPIENGWVQADAALVPESGEPRELNVLVEHYQGTTDGESWSEGSDRTDAYFGSVAPGTYTLRISGSWEPYGVTGAWSAPQSPPVAHVRVRQGVRSAWCSIATLLLLFLPLLLRWVRWFVFESRRNAEMSV